MCRKVLVAIVASFAVGSVAAESALDVDRLPIIVEPDPMEELVVDLRIGNQLAAEYFFALDRIDTIFMPLGAMAEALLFGLTVTPETGTATGWIVNDSIPFALDLAAETFTIGNRRGTLPDGVAERHVDDIYIDMEWLNTVTPLTAEMDWPTLALVVTSEKDLPAERLLERRNRWASWRPQREVDRPDPKDFPYRAYSPPAVDLSTTSRFDSRADSPLSTNANLRAAADLGWHTAQLFLQANDRSGIRDLRLTLSREDKEASLLGPLQATRYEIGDIDIPGISGVSQHRFATGLSVTNKPNGRRRDFHNRTFSGMTTPGWAVELYRNGTLIEFTEETEDGRYVFTDVEIVPGYNAFTIMELGPLGEVRQTTERLNIGSGMVPPGTVEYAFAAGRPTRLVDAGRRDRIADPSVDAFASFDIGMLTNLTVSTSVTFSDREKSRLFGEIAGRLAIGPLFLDAAMAVDQNGGRSYSLLTRLPVGDASFAAEVDIHDGLTSPYFREPPGQWQAQLSAALPLASWARLSFDYEYARDAVGRDHDRLRAQWRGSTRHLSWRNIVEAEGIAVPSDEATSIDGSLSVNLRAFRISPRLSLDYRIDDTGLQAKSTSAAFTWRMGDGYRGRFSASHHFGSDGRTQVSGGISKAFGLVSVGTSGSLDTNGDFQIGLTLATGLAWEPWQRRYRMHAEGIARHGSTSTKVILDDGTDHGPVPLEGVRVRSGARSASTDADGIAALPALGSGQVSEISVIGGTLDDPFWLIENEDLAIQSRPGIVQPTTIVVRPGGEAEGTITATRASGQIVDLSGATVLALDGEGNIAARAVAAFDGFYVINDLLPGDFHLTPDPEQIEALGYAMPEPIAFTVPPEGGIVRLENLHLLPQSPEAVGSADS